jgi:DNA modification methylase
LRSFPGNPRRHPESQIAALMKSIKQVWTNPIVIDETRTILAGHGRLEAAKRLGMKEVPTVTVSGLGRGEKKAILIADNRLPERAVWDFEVLREHFRDLIEIDFDVDLTGFTMGEVDLILDGQPGTRDPADDLSDLRRDGPAVSKVGDGWELGRHRLICGDALRGGDYQRLLGGDLAQIVITEPSFKITAQRPALERDKQRYRERGSRDETSKSTYATLLEEFIRLLVGHSQNGSIHFLLVDWTRVPDLLAAARPVYAEWKNLLVWNKGKAGHGSFYRSQHELITVFKNGTAAHINNIGVGSRGRARSNVLDYPPVSSPQPVRHGLYEPTPTAKPLALIADLIRDCSRRNGLVLDAFGRTGTTILAAERTGRAARVLEADPRYVDIAVRRWERMTGNQGRHLETGLSFAETEASAVDRASLTQQPRRRVP